MLFGVLRQARWFTPGARAEQAAGDQEEKSGTVNRPCVSPPLPFDLRYTLLQFIDKVIDHFCKDLLIPPALHYISEVRRSSHH